MRIKKIIIWVIGAMVVSFVSSLYHIDGVPDFLNWAPSHIFLSYLVQIPTFLTGLSFYLILSVLLLFPEKEVYSKRVKTLNILVIVVTLVWFILFYSDALKVYGASRYIQSCIINLIFIVSLFLVARLKEGPFLRLGYLLLSNIYFSWSFLPMLGEVK